MKQFKDYLEAVHEMPEKVQTYRLSPGSMSPRYGRIDDEVQMSRYDKIIPVIKKYGKVVKSDPGFRGRFEITFFCCTVAVMISNFIPENLGFVFIQLMLDLWNTGSVMTHTGDNILIYV